MNNLRVSIVQNHLHWENIEGNLSQFSSFAEKLKGQTDLLVLPEMFSTGFTMNAAKAAENMNGKALEWMSKTAKENQMVVTGSLVIEENNKFFNRLVWMRPDGTFDIYDKRHLFRMADEDSYYTAGNKRLIVDCKGWKICPLICYDLRFPVWSRNRIAGRSGNEQPYEVLIYVANWPERRSIAWKTLLRARAIENQAYVVGVNRIGKDGNEINYSGDSAVIDYKGETISKNLSGETFVETVVLSYDSLQDFRKSFPVTLDADNFDLI